MFKPRRLLGPTLALLCLTAGAYAYLYPGTRALFAGSVTEVMSDDTDPSPLPHQYQNLIEALRTNPARLLYGAVVINVGNPEHPAATWFPVSERVLVPLLSQLVPLEQVSTALVFTLLILTGLSFYALARVWGWSDSVAIALALAWAFCPFERARAKVHGAMVGTYHLPLIFLGLYLVARRRSRRAQLAAAICFALATTTIHYFVITAAAVAPLLLLYVWSEREDAPAATLKRLLVTAAPAVLWLVWSFTHPVPPDVNLGGESVFPRTGEVADGARHPFLWAYAARPFDYLGSDVALTVESREWLAPRRWVNARTLATLDQGNAHERTNGIRYLVLALALWGLWAGARAGDRRALVFGALGLAYFWLSLNPDQPAPGLGPSGWLQAVIAQIRVPSRAGVGVHFAALALSGLALARRPRILRWLLVPGVLPLLMILEYPPLVNPVPMSPVRPGYLNLGAPGACGVGMLFPFVSDEVYPVVYYHFKQRLRGTDCTFVNAITRPEVAKALRARFPATPESVRALERNLLVVDQLIDFARCARLRWIAFDAVTPARVRDEVCRGLGWSAHEDLTCAAPAPAAPDWSLDRACL